MSWITANGWTIASAWLTLALVQFGIWLRNRTASGNRACGLSAVGVALFAVCETETIAGVAPGKFGESAGRELPGKDFSGVLGGPGRKDVFSRYFSPLERNRPKDLDELYRRNDVELFDLQSDPGEMTNLAADRAQDAELISTMSGKLEAVINAEIGVDDGREMPDVEGINWAIDRIDM